jgi:CspA family cold shock protein
MWIDRIVSWLRSQSIDRIKGRVKFFNRKKGYGFIQADRMDKDIFVHVTSLEDEVRKGDRVAFYIQKNDKGLEAKEVKLVKS